MAAPAIKTGLNTAKPMSFAKTRHGYLVGVNGIDRGIFWDGRSATANELGVDPPSTPPVLLTPQIEKQATAVITIGTGTPSNLNTEYITIKDAFGKTVKYWFRAADPPGAVIGGTFYETYAESHINYPGGTVYVDIHGLSTAASIADYLRTTILGNLGHDGSIEVAINGAVLTLTQIQGGTAGNTPITTDIHSSHATVPAAFTGGVSTGRSGFAVINVAAGTTAHGLTAGQKITLTSTDGTIVDYFVSDTGDGGVAHLSPVTGGATLKSTGSITATLTTGATGISVGFNLSSGNQNAYLVLLKAAIEHANGHNTKLIVSAVPSATSGEDKITVHQATSGPEGNTTVTENLATVSSTAFTGGTNVLGATGGDYTCFYRYVDDREGARFYSNLSPFWVTSADADDGFFWKDLSASSQSRVTHVQLLRTTFNQATTAYVVATLPQGGSVTSIAELGVAPANRIVLTLPLGHGIVAGMRVTVSGSNQDLHNQTFEISSVTTTTATASVGYGSSAGSGTITWTLEGYATDKITDGQMVLFRGDYRQKLLQTDGRPAANRHAVPPYFKSVCCAFQDRMTYLVDPSYSTGTITASSGAVTITGSGTSWTPDLEGRLICPDPDADSNTYTIVTVTNATTITVNKALPAIASGSSYTIINPPEERNTIYISEQDLPESVITQIAIQENQRDEDELVGAIVMGAQYYALKEHSIYRVTWAKNPLLDATPQLAAMRGAINNNCADQHENILYIMDEEGPYAFQGGVQPIGMPVSDQWSDQVLDFSKKDTWSVRVDPLEELVYYFVTAIGDSGDRPKMSLVYDIRSKTWSKWTYSWEIGDSVKLTYGNQRRLLMGVTNDKFYVCNEGLKDGADNVSYSWKSGIFSWVESDQSASRFIRITFNPTGNDAAINISTYDNHSSSPTAMNEWDGGDGVSVEDGATKAIANLKVSQHEDGDEPGSKYLPWSGKLPFLRGRPTRWVTCEIFGEQSDDRIIIYEIEVGGVK